MMKGVPPMRILMKEGSDPVAIHRDVLERVPTRVFVSVAMKRFLEVWGVQQRISSAGFPHSNLRAETGVKSIK